MSEEVEEVDVCPVCQEIFLEKANLRSHMKEVHLKEALGTSEADESRSGRRPTVVANLERKQRSLAEYSAGKQEKFTEVSIFEIRYHRDGVIRESPFFSGPPSPASL